MRHSDYDQLLEAYKDDFLEDLKALIAIPSVRDDANAKAGAPFGDRIAESLNWMLKKAALDGFETANIDGYAGRITWGEGTEILGILGHLDVVPEGSGWQGSPYELRQDGDRLYGRGVQDDKGPLLAAYYAMKMLKDQGFQPQKTIHFILGTDEESDWGCMEHYFKTEPMPDMAFSPDADFPLINGEKGMFDLVLKGPAVDAPIKYLHAGSRSNVVPEKAVLAIQKSALPDDVALYFQKEAIAFTEEEDICYITWPGKAAHGMEPEKGVNAATDLADQLQDILKDLPFIQFLTQLHQDFYGEKLGIACTHEVMGQVSVNPGVIKADEEGTEITINIRYPLGGEWQQMVKQVANVAKTYGLNTYEVLRPKDPHYVPGDDPFIRTLLAAYEAETGLEGYEKSIGGGTYGRLVPRGVAFGPLFPHEEASMHQANENTSFTNLWKATAIYARAIYDLTKA